MNGASLMPYVFNVLYQIIFNWGDQIAKETQIKFAMFDWIKVNDVLTLDVLLTGGVCRKV